MISCKLSQPLPLEGKNIIEKVNNAQKIFNNSFGLKQFRPEYRGKFIFFNTNKKYKGQNLMFPERFMHITSIEDKSNYTIFPCNNDITYSKCQNKCNPSMAHPEYQKIDRSECLYRLARIHWIFEIINLANSDDASIKEWTKAERDNKGNLVNKSFIRYEEGIVDYVIILKEDVRGGKIYKYHFITAFPVFTKRNKIQYDSDFNKYAQNKKSATSGTLK